DATGEALAVHIEALVAGIDRALALAAGDHGDPALGADGVGVGRREQAGQPFGLGLAVSADRVDRGLQAPPVVRLLVGQERDAAVWSPAHARDREVPIGQLAEAATVNTANPDLRLLVVERTGAVQAVAEVLEVADPLQVARPRRLLVLGWFAVGVAGPVGPSQDREAGAVGRPSEVSDPARGLEHRVRLTAAQVDHVEVLPPLLLPVGGERQAPAVGREAGVEVAALAGRQLASSGR